jgi:hypothetical protein
MKRLVLTAAIVAQLFAGTSSLHAQQAAETPVTPSPLTPAPVVPPKKPADASESYDANAVQQLVTISKNTGDSFIRLDDMLKSNSLVQEVLGTIRKVNEDTKLMLDTALTGTKTVPLNNTPEDATARVGAVSLRELAVQMIGGAAPALAEVATAIAEIRTVFNLGEVAKLINSKELADRLSANVAGHALAATSVAETSYASTNTSMTRLGSYIEALGASADLKTSVDLNTRVLIELTQQTNEAIRTNAATSTVISAYLMAMLGGESDPEDRNIFLDLNKW